jgi:hypothetical protein
MADLYRERKLQIPEDIAPLISEVDNNQNIIIEKKVFGSTAMNSLLDRGFSEVLKSKKADLTKFFKDYDDLFYDIPKHGEQKSHNSIILRSTDFVRDFIDPKDQEINDLEARVEELLEEIEELKNPEEHPYFANGTVFSRGGGGNYWIMEKGKRRSIVGGSPGRVWKALIQARGY